MINGDLTDAGSRHNTSGVCVAGMHRSGTSMVSGILNAAGVYLGEGVDLVTASGGENSGGFWEHFGFYALNERLLQHLGAGWDAPYLSDRWADRADIEPFREEARHLVARMRDSVDGGRLWGWKDPRNSITIQFWKSVLPNLKVVICVRNPAEVVASLQARNNLSLAAASRLWLLYYENIIKQVSYESRVVTCYDHYFSDFEAEFNRVLTALGVSVGEEESSRAKSRVNVELHHNKAGVADLYGGDFSPDVLRLYEALQAEARTGLPVSVSLGAVSVPGVSALHEDPRLDFKKSRFHAETAQREEHMRRLSLENAQLREKLMLSDEKLTLCEKNISMLRERLSYTAEQLRACDDSISVLRDRNTAQLAVLSELAARSIAMHELLEGCNTKLMVFQCEFNKHLKDSDFRVVRWIGRSEFVNFIYRCARNVLNAGRQARLQKAFNIAIVQNSSQSLQVMSAMLRNHASADFILPGLSVGSITKAKVDISQLSVLLRQRI